MTLFLLLVTRMKLTECDGRNEVLDIIREYEKTEWFGETTDTSQFFFLGQFAIFLALWSSY